MDEFLPTQALHAQPICSHLRMLQYSFSKSLHTPQLLMSLFSYSLKYYLS